MAVFRLFCVQPLGFCHKVSVFVFYCGEIYLQRVLLQGAAAGVNQRETKWIKWHWNNNVLSCVQSFKKKKKSLNEKVRPAVGRNLQRFI